MASSAAWNNRAASALAAFSELLDPVRVSPVDVDGCGSEVCLERGGTRSSSLRTSKDEFHNTAQISQTPLGIAVAADDLCDVYR